MANNRLENATHISKIKGVMESRTDLPTDQGPAGLKTGRRFYHSTQKKVYIRTANAVFRHIELTTTSTSTTTTSTSTTTTSTSTT